MIRTPERWRTEVRWAWRNVRARGWRATLAVALLALAIAANAVVFSVADSIVFHRAPYFEPDRLVEIQRRDSRTGRPGDSFVSPALLDEWRRQSDLFAGVEGHLSKTAFLSGDAEPEAVAIADVTVGLLDLLGARPRWGRGFAEGDDRQTDLLPILLAESLARARFGDPAAAVGQRLELTAGPLLVIGVMPADFRFPDGAYRIWRPLDPRGPLTRNFVGVFSIARVAPGMPLDTLSRAMEQRSADLGRAAGERMAYSAQPAPMRSVMVPADQRRLFFVLLGAAACLLLIACANVASLELASAVQRARTYAIQLAVGASRAGLARVAMLEGACLVGCATVGAAFLARGAVDVIVRHLPPYLARGSANPIDVDERTLIFMAAAAGLVWLLSTLPVVMYASTGNLLDLLKLEGHSVAASGRSGLARRALTVAEVALAVMLLVGSIVYVRSYLALLALDKGFDASGVVMMSLSIPPQAYQSVAEKRALGREAVDRLRQRPGVIAVANSTPPPDMGPLFGVGQLQIDDRAPLDESVTVAQLDVEPEYFSALRIPLRAGRAFETGEPATNTIVSETFAKQYWPDENAVGRRFRIDPKRPWYHIVGVAGHVRTRHDPPGERSTRAFQTYVPRQPPPPPPPAQTSGPRTIDTGGSFGFVTVMARVDSRARAADLYQTVRAIDSRFILKLQFVDDAYAQYFDDRLLATRVIGAFGLLAFVIAAAGIYGVMAFLVAHRSHEIGIRMALGADARRISRLVVGSSLRLVLVGAAIGTGGAIAVSRWVQSQLFGVRAADPITIALVTLGVTVTALLATWRPARQAVRIDPRLLLKN